MLIRHHILKTTLFLRNSIWMSGNFRDKFFWFKVQTSYFWKIQMNVFILFQFENRNWQIEFPFSLGYKFWKKITSKRKKIPCDTTVSNWTQIQKLTFLSKKLPKCSYIETNFFGFRVGGILVLVRFRSVFNIFVFLDFIVMVITNHYSKFRQYKLIRFL